MGKKRRAVPRSFEALAALGAALALSAGCPRASTTATPAPKDEARGASTGGNEARAKSRSAGSADIRAGEKGENGDPDGGNGPAREPSRGDRPPNASGRPSPAVQPAGDAMQQLMRTTGRMPDSARPAPDHPPDNPFGYAQAVKRCFPGQVYALPEDAKRLPRRYERLQLLDTVYACEWNVGAQRSEKGFGRTDRSAWFAIRYEGVFRVTETGEYRFHLRSDDGSRLQVDGEVVVNNDGRHAPYTKSGTKELRAGDHQLVLEYFQGPPYHVALQLWVTPPGGEPGLLSVRPQ